MKGEQNTTPDQLREAIIRYGNNAKLARTAGVTRQTVISFLRGGGLRLETFLSLCQVLGLNPPRLIHITVEKGTGTRTRPMIFSELQAREIPDQLTVSEDDARLLLELKNTGDPYHVIKLAVMILQSGKVTLPETDTLARRTVSAAIGLLTDYMR